MMCVYLSVLQDSKFPRSIKDCNVINDTSDIDNHFVESSLIRQNHYHAPPCIVLGQACKEDFKPFYLVHILPSVNEALTIMRLCQLLKIRVVMIQNIVNVLIYIIF